MSSCNEKGAKSKRIIRIDPTKLNGNVQNSLKNALAKLKAPAKLAKVEKPASGNAPPQDQNRVPVIRSTATPVQLATAGKSIQHAKPLNFHVAEPTKAILQQHVEIVSPPKVLSTVKCLIKDRLQTKIQLRERHDPSPPVITTQIHPPTLVEIDSLAVDPNQDSISIPIEELEVNSLATVESSHLIKVQLLPESIPLPKNCTTGNEPQSSTDIANLPVIILPEHLEITTESLEVPQIEPLISPQTSKISVLENIPAKDIDYVNRMISGTNVSVIKPAAGPSKIVASDPVVEKVVASNSQRDADADGDFVGFDAVEVDLKDQQTRFNKIIDTLDKKKKPILEMSKPQPVRKPDEMRRTYRGVKDWLVGTPKKKEEEKTIELEREKEAMINEEGEKEKEALEIKSETIDEGVGNDIQRRNDEVSKGCPDKEVLVPEEETVNQQETETVPEQEMAMRKTVELKESPHELDKKPAESKSTVDELKKSTKESVTAASTIVKEAPKRKVKFKPNIVKPAVTRGKPSLGSKATPPSHEKKPNKICATGKVIEMIGGTSSQFGTVARCEIVKRSEEIMAYKESSPDKLLSPVVEANASGQVSNLLPENGPVEIAENLHPKRSCLKKAIEPNSPKSPTKNAPLESMEKKTRTDSPGKSLDENVSMDKKEETPRIVANSGPELNPKSTPTVLPSSSADLSDQTLRKSSRKRKSMLDLLKNSPSFKKLCEEISAENFSQTDTEEDDGDEESITIPKKLFKTLFSKEVLGVKVQKEKKEAIVEQLSEKEKEREPAAGSSEEMTLEDQMIECDNEKELMRDDLESPKEMEEDHLEAAENDEVPLVFVPEQELQTTLDDLDDSTEEEEDLLETVRKSDEIVVPEKVLSPNKTNTTNLRFDGTVAQRFEEERPKDQVIVAEKVSLEKQHLGDSEAVNRDIKKSLEPVLRGEEATSSFVPERELSPMTENLKVKDSEADEDRVCESVKGEVENNSVAVSITHDWDDPDGDVEGAFSEEEPEFDRLIIDEVQESEVSPEEKSVEEEEDVYNDIFCAERSPSQGDPPPGNKRKTKLVERVEVPGVKEETRKDQKKSKGSKNKKQGSKAEVLAIEKPPVNSPEKKKFDERKVIAETPNVDKTPTATETSTATETPINPVGNSSTQPDPVTERLSRNVRKSSRKSEWNIVKSPVKPAVKESEQVEDKKSESREKLTITLKRPATRRSNMMEPIVIAGSQEQPKKKKGKWASKEVVPTEDNEESQEPQKRKENVESKVSPQKKNISESQEVAKTNEELQVVQGKEESFESKEPLNKKEIEEEPSKKIESGSQELPKMQENVKSKEPPKKKKGRKSRSQELVKTTEQVESQEPSSKKEDEESQESSEMSKNLESPRKKMITESQEPSKENENMETEDLAKENEKVKSQELAKMDELQKSPPKKKKKVELVTRKDKLTSQSETENIRTRSRSPVTTSDSSLSASPKRRRESKSSPLVTEPKSVESSPKKSDTLEKLRLKITRSNSPSSSSESPMRSSRRERKLSAKLMEAKESNGAKERNNNSEIAPLDRKAKIVIMRKTVRPQSDQISSTDELTLSDLDTHIIPISTPKRTRKSIATTNDSIESPEEIPEEMEDKKVLPQNLVKLTLQRNSRARQGSSTPKGKVKSEKKSSVPEKKTPVKSQKTTPPQPTQSMINQFFKPSNAPETASTKDFICGNCKQTIPMNAWTAHTITHNGLAWREGIDPKINLESEKEITKIMQNLLMKKKLSHLQCEKCAVKRQSAVGYMSHLRVCGLDQSEYDDVKIPCEYCGSRMMPVSMQPHLKYCHVLKEIRAKGGVAKKKEKGNDETGGEVELSRVRSGRGRLLKTPKQNQVNLRDQYKRKTFSYRSQVKWKGEFNRGLNMHCFSNMCKVELADYEEMMAHHKSCEKVQAYKYACNICHTETKASVDMERHLMEKHFAVEKEEEEQPEPYHDDSEASAGVESSDSEGSSGASEHSEGEEESDKGSSASFAGGAPKIKKGGERIRWRGEMDPFWRKYGLPKMMKYSTRFKSITVKNFSADPLYVDWTVPKVKDLYIVNKDFEDNSEECSESFVNIKCGMLIESIAWVPVPDERQILALLCKPKTLPYMKMSHQQPTETIIQMWGVEKDANFSATHLYSIVRADGPICGMRICPSGGYTEQRLGLMALTSVTGDVNIIPFPHPLDKFKGKGLKLPARCVLKCTVDSIGTALDWDLRTGHRVIVGGFLNGMIAMWRLDSSASRLLSIDGENGREFLPFRILQPFSDPVTSVAMNGNFFVAAGGAVMKIFDMSSQDCGEVSQTVSGAMLPIPFARWIPNTHFVICSIFLTLTHIGLNVVTPCSITMDHFRLIATTSQVVAGAFDPELNVVVGGTRKGEIYVADMSHEKSYQPGDVYVKKVSTISDGKVEEVTKSTAEAKNPEAVKCIEFHPKGEFKGWYAVGYEKGLVRVNRMKPTVYKK